MAEFLTQSQTARRIMTQKRAAIMYNRLSINDHIGRIEDTLIISAKYLQTWEKYLILKLLVFYSQFPCSMSLKHTTNLSYHSH
jgi:hypothetical protein